MKGLVFDLSIPKYVMAKAVGKQFPKIHYGRISSLRLGRDIAAPKLPGPEWVRLRTRMAGFCGSDLATLFFKFSPALQPFNSFPAVLGHEILADIVEVGPKVRGLEPGQRVAVNPLLPCRLREISPPCIPCERGNEAGCERTAEGCFAPGSMIGFCRELPGGMGEELVAHASQLFPLPDAVKDEAGVLMEPLAVSVHAVLKNAPEKHERVLIIGGGPVAFATLWALRALGHAQHVTLMSFDAYQLELARKMGADDTLRVTKDDEEAAEIARRTGGRMYRPIIGPPTITGGYDVIYECVGSRDSFQDAVRYTRSGGRIVLIGAAGILHQVDLTMVWRNELTIAGSYVYGPELFRGQRMHTFEVVRTLLAEGAGPDAAQLCTHTFPLEQYQQAIEANLFRGRYKSVKTAFDFRRPS
ncbi:MAG: alcohol dehydrogenase catalytic domain-containing protein [Myxococcaceae bacterium]|nr:alcohol dehydrogenase catalytic domain-containing protein [Myxococcaceae bacterium]